MASVLGGITRRMLLHCHPERSEGPVQLFMRELVLNLWIEIEESLQARLQLFLNVLLAAFEHVHGDVRFAAVL